VELMQDTATSGDRFGHFNADAYTEALEEPTLRIGNLLYRGRLLSLPEWLPVAAQLDAIGTRQRNGEDVPIDETIQIYRKYLRLVFPRRRFLFWAPDPVAALFCMPWGVVTEAISRFFVLQALASTPRKSPSETNGMLSAPPIAPSEATAPL
jgi:hypothetical protein